MEEEFDSNVLRLEKQINNITQNINKFKNKNHKTMKNIMEKIKYFSNEMNNKNEIINMTRKTLYSITYSFFYYYNSVCLNTKQKCYYFFCCYNYNCSFLKHYFL